MLNASRTEISITLKILPRPLSTAAHTHNQQWQNVLTAKLANLTKSFPFCLIFPGLLASLHTHTQSLPKFCPKVSAQPTNRNISTKFPFSGKREEKLFCLRPVISSHTHTHTHTGKASKSDRGLTLLCKTWITTVFFFLPLFFLCLQIAPREGKLPLPASV